VKFILRDLFKRFEVVDTGVVNQDVDLPERLLCFSEQTLDIFLLRDVALNGDRFSAALANFVNDFVSIRFRGCLINDHSRAFGGELFGDTRADSFRRTGYNRDFICQFSIFHSVPFVFWFSKIV
jgi:hypothetical protein